MENLEDWNHENQNMQFSNKPAQFLLSFAQFLITSATIRYQIKLQNNP